VLSNVVAWANDTTKQSAGSARSNEASWHGRFHLHPCTATHRGEPGRNAHRDRHSMQSNNRGQSARAAKPQLPPPTCDEVRVDLQKEVPPRAQQLPLVAATEHLELRVGIAATKCASNSTR
jgi:hypothetical protein